MTRARQRTRPIMKMVYFTLEEWERVEALMGVTRSTNFSEFARKMILNGSVYVNSRPMDALKVKAMLAPIGNNINQIARQVNIDQVLYLEDLGEVRALMERAVAILERYAKCEDYGDS